MKLWDKTKEVVKKNALKVAAFVTLAATPGVAGAANPESNPTQDDNKNKTEVKYTQDIRTVEDVNKETLDIMVQAGMTTQEIYMTASFLNHANKLTEDVVKNYNPTSQAVLNQKFVKRLTTDPDRISSVYKSEVNRLSKVNGKNELEKAEDGSLLKLAAGHIVKEGIKDLEGHKVITWDMAIKAKGGLEK